MPELYLLLGWLARRDGKLEDAQRYFLQAIKYRSDYFEGHYWLGRTSLDVRDHRKRCKKELDIALNLDPGFGPPYTLQGGLLITLPGTSGIKEALAAYEEALQRAPPDDEDLPKLRERVEALRTYVEFESNKGEAQYERPRALNFPRPNYNALCPGR
jgi:tetratricopeptide (TPR) repeat protein